MSSTETRTGWRALLVPVDGPIRDVTISSASDGLPDLQRLTGAHYVEVIHGPADVDVWIDDEGAITNPPRPVNPRLTAWAARRDNWPLRGDAVITGPADDAGDITSLSPEAAEQLRAAIGGERP